MLAAKRNYALILAAILAGVTCLFYLLPWIWAWNTLPASRWTEYISNRDFVNYWLGAKLASDGQYMDLFAHDSYFPHIEAFIGSNAEIRSWSYPPHFLLLVRPLALLDYTTALLTFLSATFALFVWSVVLCRREFAPRSNAAIVVFAVVGYAVMMFDATQNGFLTAALTLFALTWMRTRPAASGCMFALLTVKPQLGFLFLLLLLLDRNWRVLLWGVIAAALLLAASIALYGIESWQAYSTTTLAYQRSVMTHWYGIFLNMMPTTFGGMRALGYTPETALYAQLPVSLAGAIGVVWILGRETDPLRRVFAVACGTFLITPYAFNYDMGALAVTAALLAGAANGRPGSSSILFAAVATLPGVVMNLGRGGLPISPLLIGAALAIVANEARGSASPSRLAVVSTQNSLGSNR